MRLLSHACCGPCFLVPAEEFAGESLAVHYYNPNIHPYGEYRRRLEVLERYCDERGIELVVDEYRLEDYFRAVHGREAKPERCRACYRLRLERTAAHAAANGYDAFTTSLLLSPYQQHHDLRVIGADAAERRGTRFVYRDLRPHYRHSVELSRQLGMYRQNYCGCVFSEKERADAREARRRKAVAVGES